jgi:uncharacterized peroxidase-related enzyme
MTRLGAMFASARVTKHQPHTLKIMKASSITFPPHTLESAPAASQPVLQRLREAVGAIPNLAGAMAESPVLIDAFVTLRGLFHAKSSFAPVERELLFLVNAVENGCEYCTAIHATFAVKSGAPQETVDAVRSRRPLADARQQTLVEFARRVVRERGRVGPDDLQRFVDAGFEKHQALEVLAALAISTMANYGRHLTHAPLDEFLLPQTSRPVAA